MNALEILSLVARTEFRPFTKVDWMLYAGCESAEPFIGENGDYVILIDGETIAVMDDEGEQYSARVESCWSL